MDRVKERVLVFPRKVLPNFRGCMPFNPLLWRSILKGAFFLSRSEAEDSKTYKQIIPYVVFLVGDRCLSYRRTRAGSETRLRSLWSIGIGGHVNPKDDEKDGDLEGIIRRGLLREVREELGLDLDEPRLRLVGFINDDETPVGFVHFGLLFLARLRREEWEKLSPETTIGDLCLVDLKDPVSPAQGRDYETWSQFAAKFLVSTLEEGRLLCWS